MWGRGVTASWGEAARGDGACRLCPHCLQARKLVASFPASLSASSKAEVEQCSAQDPPGAGFAQLSRALLRQQAPAGAVQSWGYPQELQQRAELT